MSANIPRDLDGAPVYDRREDVVLDLLVDDHDDGPDDCVRGEAVEEGHDPNDDRGDRGADEREQVEHADDYGQRCREPDAEQWAA